ncbi:MAG: hypothetical protein ACI9XO_004818 [Paraglaciecola sp.]|jgi:hypothetical protein
MFKRENIKYEITAFIIVLILFFLAFLDYKNKTAFIVDFRDHSELGKEEKIDGDVLTTTGIITRVGSEFLSTSTKFKYEINGKEYKGSLNVPWACLTGSEISNHTYKVVYSKENPEDAMILVTSEMYREYDLILIEESKVFYDKYWECD